MLADAQPEPEQAEPVCIRAFKIAMLGFEAEPGPRCWLGWCVYVHMCMGVNVGRKHTGKG